jgi:hypothetical protein
MSDDKFGDENPQTAAFLLPANQINMEQVKEQLDERYAPAEAHVEQALRIDELAADLKKYKFINNMQHIWWAAWVVGLVVWLLLK